ncbi:hypothetical protein QBC40DRAFT_288323 [Triangularia verruculosa]|uniref:LITAF domain-containing protein n=1 Tax=Triangularia verruculosa TaxID=2587418 RepID=A0AAN7ARJ0_9PEZI|nr:hypothetical protein QBC40DRAFT_288323 [Triangularia verruculosa]
MAEASNLEPPSYTSATTDSSRQLQLGAGGLPPPPYAATLPPPFQAAAEREDIVQTIPLHLLHEYDHGPYIRWIDCPFCLKGTPVRRAVTRGFQNGVLKMWLGWSIITGGIGMFYRPTHNDTVDYFCGECQNKVATSHPDRGPMETFGPGGQSRTFAR